MADDVDGEAPCVCGGVIARDRRDGFCSSWCRTRDAQGLAPQAPPPLRPTVLAPVGVEGPQAAVGNVGGRAAASAGDDGDDEPRRPRYRQRRRPIADEVEDRLRDADMLNTWQGAAALDLADALDWAGGSGSARAALHRELDRAMSNLLRGVDESGSKLGAARDELAARRARRAGGA